MKITVLGGCGFIGSAVAERMAMDGHQVTVYDRPDANTDNLRNVREKIHFETGDFVNQQDWDAILSGADIVFHCISTTLPSTALQQPVFDAETNVVGSLKLFAACVQHKVGKVVFISSGGTVYGIPHAIPINENAALNPITPYGVSKLAIEKYLSLYHYHYGLDYTILRLSNPYGIRQNPHTGQGVLASWVHQLKNGRSIEIWGDGEIVRDYIYIDDAVDAIKRASLVTTELKTLNVGAGQGYSLNQLHQLLEEVAGQKITVEHKAVRKVDVPVNVLDIGLIRASLGWEPATSMRAGLLKLWQGIV